MRIADVGLGTAGASVAETEELTAHTAKLCIGIDLDLTLVDTRRTTASALVEVNKALSVAIDVDEFVRRLGPPMHDELLRWMAPDQVEEAIDLFMSAFTSDRGLQYLSPLAGARELLAWMNQWSYRSVVITSRWPSVASKILRHCGLELTAMHGGLTGVGKAPAMKSERISMYVGDHPLDMEGAAAAGVPAIGVASGSHSQEELAEAGAFATFPSLNEFRIWLENKENWIFAPHSTLLGKRPKG